MGDLLSEIPYRPPANKRNKNKKPQLKMDKISTRGGKVIVDDMDWEDMDDDDFGFSGTIT